MRSVGYVVPHARPCLIDKAGFSSLCKTDVLNAPVNILYSGL
jgi:hypothetical protein